MSHNWSLLSQQESLWQWREIGGLWSSEPAGLGRVPQETPSLGVQGLSAEEPGLCSARIGVALCLDATSLWLELFLHQGDLTDLPTELQTQCHQVPSRPSCLPTGHSTGHGLHQRTRAVCAGVPESPGGPSVEACGGGLHLLGLPG